MVENAELVFKDGEDLDPVTWGISLTQMTLINDIDK